MRVFFVNRFYRPAETATAQLLTDLAEALAARGWKVLVVTGHSDPGLPRHETHNGVGIFRVGRRMGRTQRLARKAVDFVLFHLCALPVLWRNGRRHDVFVALTDPPLLGVTVTIAAALRRAHAIHWVQDIYPEIVPAVNPSIAAKMLSAVLRRPRDIAWRRAAACVTLGREMVAHIQSCGLAPDRTHVVPNWAPRGVAPAPTPVLQALREEWQLGGRFLVSYSGNFGRVHDLRHILDVADRLRPDPRFLFLFIGDGAAFAALRRGAEARQLSNVRFLPARPRHELSASLGIGDVQLVSLRAGCERLVFPSKLYGITAAGRPTFLLAAPESEIARLVRDEDLGVVFRPSDVEGIVAGLKNFADDPGLQKKHAAAAMRFSAANGGCDRAVQSWDEILRSAAGVTAPLEHPAHPRTAQPAS